MINIIWQTKVFSLFSNDHLFAEYVVLSSAHCWSYLPAACFYKACFHNACFYTHMCWTWPIERKWGTRKWNPNDNSIQRCMFTIRISVLFFFLKKMKAPVAVYVAIHFQEHSWRHYFGYTQRVNKSDICCRKSFILFHTCATCSELQSYINTMTNMEIEHHI